MTKALGEFIGALSDEVAKEVGFERNQSRSMGLKSGL
jgi:hypothetical protein